MEPSQMRSVTWNQANDLMIQKHEQTSLSCSWNGFAVRVTIGVHAKNNNQWSVEMKVHFQDEKTQKTAAKKIHLLTGQNGVVGVFLHPEEGRGLRHFNLLSIAPIEKEKIKADVAFLAITAANNGIILTANPPPS
jgi:L-lactate utilization protein LutC